MLESRPPPGHGINRTIIWARNLGYTVRLVNFRNPCLRRDAFSRQWKQYKRRNKDAHSLWWSLFFFRWETKIQYHDIFTSGMHPKKYRIWPSCLKKKNINFLLQHSLDQYKLEDAEVWPRNGTLNYNIISQPDLFCPGQGKWTEIPYVQVFIAPRNDSKCAKTVR